MTRALYAIALFLLALVLSPLTATMIVWERLRKLAKWNLEELAEVLKPGGGPVLYDETFEDDLGR